MRKIKAFLTSLIFTGTIASSVITAAPAVTAAGSYDMTVSVDLSGERKEISPYIYGVNQYTSQDDYKKVTATAIRQGGNRMTAYNWETNASNAGSDWQHSSDTNLSTSEDPADCAKKFSAFSVNHGFDYKFTTLQLAGYVAADKNGPVSESEAAPSKRWNKVVLTKNAPFDDTPDLNDGVVYMDEYVSYLVKNLGDSTTSTGIQGYSLDNEPALWAHTHSRMHPQPVTIEELSSKSIEMAKAIKAIDPHAETFGPALYGYTAYDHLADDDNSNEWETIKAANNYNWYIDCYLDQMKKASDEAGTRLLDVLDIHYYSESAREGAEDRVQSVRTLYEKGFAENSWIGQWCQQNIPILPTIQDSIDKYYPGTKLAISEYNFGGDNDVSGTIAQAEALGCYADAGVYLATLWGNGNYIYSGINLYTNYDGKGSCFGNTLVPTTTEDVSLSSAYAAVNGNDNGFVTAMITNKNMTDGENVSLKLNNSDKEYKSAAVYAVYGDSSDIRLVDVIENISGNTVNVELPAYCAAMVAVSDDPTEFDDLDPSGKNDPVFKTVTINDPESNISSEGFVVLPIEDPEHLSKIVLTADVSSSAGSAWATAGCALSINAVDKNGTGFWTSKTYNLALGNGSTATIDFDGTFMNDETEVEAVISDGKVELQKWWDSSEKQESSAEDIISVKYTKAEIIYKYPPTEIVTTAGDINMDGKITLVDAVMLRKFLVKLDTLSNKQLIAADACKDGVVNIYDSIMIQRIYRNNLLGIN